MSTASQRSGIDEDETVTASRHRWRVWPAIGGAAVVWLALGGGLIRLWLASALRGSGPAFLQRFLAGLGKSPERILAQWDGVVLAGLLMCLVFGLVVWWMTGRTFYRRFVGAATPGTLGAIRMLACGILFVLALTENLASTAGLPRAMIVPPGVFFKLLYALPIGFASFVADPIALRIFQWVTTALLFCGAIGFNTRLTVPLGGLCYLVLYGILCQYFWFFHQGLVPLYLILLVLSWTPCGDGWSVDRLMRAAKGRPVPPAAPAAIYGWARFACWVTLAMPYVAAGLSKLRAGGLAWFDPVNMRAIFYLDSLNPMEFNWDGGLRLIHAPDWLVVVLGGYAVVGEVLYGSVIVSRTARLIFPPMMALMHLGILFVQNILFIDLILLQAIFFDWGPVRRAIAERWLGLRRTDAKATPSEPSPAWRGPVAAAPLAVSGIMTLLAFCWLYRVEHFPLTGMPMYQKPHIQVVTYYKALATSESGERSPALFDRIVGRMRRNGRYRRIVRQCFQSEGAEACRQFLQACGASYNRAAAPGGRIVEVEAQQWRWDFVAQPPGPEYGALAQRVAVSIPE